MLWLGLGGVLLFFVVCVVGWLGNGWLLSVV